MTDELQAAAERLKTYEGGTLHIPCDVEAALWTLANWALPLLDPTPIDEAWLRECGWKGWDVPSEEEPYSLYVPAGEFVTWELRLAWGYGLSMVRLHDNRKLVVESVELVNAKTRGQLRLLCLALGIELKEPTP